MKTNLGLLICLYLALAGILTEVQCLRRRPHKQRPRSTAKPYTGWRVGNGPCICKGPHPTGRHTPTAHHGPHPMGHHTPTGHHGPHPTGHPRPSGHHGPHPTGHPRPSGHHGPHPMGHHTPTGHHGPHPTGRHTPRRGHHGPRRRTGRITRCRCRRRSERTSKIRFRMNKKWDESYADDTSPAYKEMAKKLETRLMKVLKVKQFAEKMRFKKGSIIVEFAVAYDVSENGSKSEDPDKLLRNALNGELKDLDIYPDSLAVSESYSGVKLTEWKTSALDCIVSCHAHGKSLIKQSRTCTEVKSSCDGIPLTREVCCEEGCRLSNARHKGASKANKVLAISCVVITIVFVIAVIIILITVKKSRHKYVSTSPSTSSLKELANNDQLQSKKC